MTIQDDLARIELQEQTLRFPQFNADTAWRLGSALRQAADEKGASVAVDITLAGAPLFYCAMEGATPNNAEWIRRKKNVVQRFHKSSYAVGLDMRRNNTTLEAQLGAPLADYVSAGGCFPLRLTSSSALLGTITVSGLPERQDHQLVVRTIAGMLKVNADTVLLAEQ